MTNPMAASGFSSNPNKGAAFEVSGPGDVEANSRPALSTAGSRSKFASTASRSKSTAGRLRSATAAFLGGDEGESASSVIVRNLAPAYVVEGATADLYEVNTTAAHDSYSCYLWKQSKYYSKIPFNPKAWQLRWATVDSSGFRTYRNRGSNKGVKSTNLFEATSVEIVDSERFIIRVQAPSSATYFQAPSEEIMVGVHQMLLKQHAVYAALSSDTRRAMRFASVRDPENVTIPAEGSAAEPVSSKTIIAAHEADDDEDHEDLMNWPESNIGVFFHLILLPVKVALYYTISDVRRPGNEAKYAQAMIMSVFFLAFFSFIMTECMEMLGPMVGISEYIMGVVFAAGGTSFPNVFASMVVARQGLGNAAISNALGGNIFNIFLGLGLPWFFFCLYGSEFVDTKAGVYYGLHVRCAFFTNRSVSAYSHLIATLII